jgi:hypothetical protein
MIIASSTPHRLPIQVVFLLFICSNAFSAELSGTPEELRGYLRSETRTVTISDVASEVAYTDIAKITLIVSTKEKTLALALEQNNDLRASVFQKLTQSGIPADDIQSSKYSASPQYGWFGSSPSSFEVINSLVVTVDEEPSFRRVAEISDQSDSIVFGGVEFEHSEKEAYEDKVRDKAVNSVMKDREYFEEKLGLELRPISFTFSDVHSAGLDRYGAIEEVIVTGSRIGSSRGDSAIPPPSFDEIEYRVSVAITFEVDRSE